MAEPQPQYEFHISDLKQYKECRWRWEWTAHAPLGRYLEPDRPQPHFQLGRAVHFAMDRYYSGQGDLVEAYKQYMERDVVLIEHLDAISGDEKSKLLINIQLGLGMLEHYRQWAPPRDKQYRVVSTEFPFKFDTGYGMLAGRYDGIWEDLSDGTLWLKEFKTAKSIKDIDWIHKDEQPMFYAWAAEKLLNIPIEGVLYTFLRKTVPEPPDRLMNRDFSRAKSQHTTAALYIEALRNDARGMAKRNDGTIDAEVFGRLYDAFVAEYQDVINYFLEHEEYFLRKPLRKTRAQLDINFDLMEAVVREILAGPEMYPSPSPIKCARCAFKDPCDLRLAGADYEVLLKEEYRERTPWDDEELEDEGVADGQSRPQV